MKSIILTVLGVIMLGMGAWLFLRGTNQTITPQVNLENQNQTIEIATTSNATSSESSAVNTPAPAKPVTPTQITPSAYTAATVAQHKSQSDCWTIVDGVVYDLTSFITKHPGGARSIATICGVDGTAAFSGQHGESEKANMKLNSLILGPVGE